MISGPIQKYLKNRKKPLTYEYLSRITGVSVGHLVMLNSGKRNPSLRMIETLERRTRHRINRSMFRWNGENGKEK